MVEISIQYCAVWHYTDRAIGLMAELLKQHEDKIQSISLIPSDGGAFEVEVDGKLVYSKLQTGRHAEDGEIARLMQKLL